MAVTAKAPVLTDLFSMRHAESDQARVERHKLRSANFYDYVKLIAFVTMVIDHVAYYYILPYEWLRAIGRLSAPLYLFMSGWHLSTEITPKLVMSILVTTWLHYYLEHRTVPLDILYSMALVRFLLRFILPRVDWLEVNKRSSNSAESGVDSGRRKPTAKRMSTDADLPPRTLLPRQSGEQAFYRLRFLFPTVIVTLALAFLFSHMQWVLLDYDWTGVLYILIGAHARLATRLCNETASQSEAVKKTPVSLIDYAQAALIDAGLGNFPNPVNASPNVPSGKALSSIQARVYMTTTIASLFLLGYSHYYIYQNMFGFQGVAQSIHALAIVLATSILVWTILRNLRMFSQNRSDVQSDAVSSRASSRQDIFSKMANSTPKIIGWIAKFSTSYSIELYVVHLLIIFVTMPQFDTIPPDEYMHFFESMQGSPTK